MDKKRIGGMARTPLGKTEAPAGNAMEAIRAAIRPLSTSPWIQASQRRPPP
jgi:hypothetical protein